MTLAQFVCQQVMSSLKGPLAGFERPHSFEASFKLSKGLFLSGSAW